MAADIGEAIAHPSASAVGWILLDVVSFADPTGIGSATAHAVKAAHVMEETIHAAQITKKVIRNPFGRAGGALHQAKIGNVIKQIEAKGLTTKTEYAFHNAKGVKKVRYADVVGLDSRGRVAEIHQVGRSTKRFRAPVSRERAAIRDIRGASNYNGARIYYHRYD
ncbi:MAG: hypothetical protein Q8936_22540 [Bacillota bacterium]|nr:hypothetical protein [Bacillota bacterium]